eukprot:6150577-Pyramimonas_sp.AAC.1
MAVPKQLQRQGVGITWHGSLGIWMLIGQETRALCSSSTRYQVCLSTRQAAGLCECLADVRGH